MRQTNAGARFFMVAVVGALAPLAWADVRPYAKIADLNTSIPGGTGNFTARTPARVNAGDIVSGGGGAAGQVGIYRYDPASGTRTTVVDTHTVLPYSPGPQPPGFSPLLNDLNSLG